MKKGFRVEECAPCLADDSQAYSARTRGDDALGWGSCSTSSSSSYMQKVGLKCGVLAMCCACDVVR